MRRVARNTIEHLRAPLFPVQYISGIHDAKMFRCRVEGKLNLACNVGNRRFFDSFEIPQNQKPPFIRKRFKNPFQSLFFYIYTDILPLATITRVRKIKNLV